MKQSRSAVMKIFKEVELAGEDGIVSEFSPGVFLQVYLFFLENFILTMLQVHLMTELFTCYMLSLLLNVFP